MSLSELVEQFYISPQLGDSGVVLEAHRDHILIQSDSGVCRVIPITALREWEFYRDREQWEEKLRSKQCK